MCVSVKMNRPDGMDLLLSVEEEISLNVESQPKNTRILDELVSAPTESLNVEAPIPHTKSCSIKLTRLETILFENNNKPRSPPFKPGEHYTQSKLKPKPARSTRNPHAASTGKTYYEAAFSDDDKPPVHPKTLTQAAGDPLTLRYRHKTGVLKPLRYDYLPSNQLQKRLRRKSLVLYLS